MSRKNPQTEATMDPAVFLTTSVGDSFYEQASHLGVVMAEDPGDDDNPWESFVAWSYDQEGDPSCCLMASIN